MRWVMRRPARGNGIGRRHVAAVGAAVLMAVVMPVDDPAGASLERVSTAGAALSAAADLPTPLMQPAAGAPGTQVVLRSTCSVPAGLDVVMVVIELASPGAYRLAEGIAGWQAGAHPAYSPDGTRIIEVLPEGAAVLRDDESWVASLWVPYGTAPGSYEVRARCHAHINPLDAGEEQVFDYEPQPFTVTGWPAIPPTFNADFPGGLLVDGTGSRHVWGWKTDPPVGGDGWWPQRDVARGVGFAAGRLFDPEPYGGGVVVDAFGRIHRFEEPGIVDGLAPPEGAPHWPGWDIARGVALTRLDSSGSMPNEPPHEAAGIVVDGWGGLHPFRLGSGAGPVTVTPGTGPYWPGWDIARDVALLPFGQGGYVLDGWGGLHPFGLNGRPAPLKPVLQPYWHGWDVARGVVLLDERSGYVFDAWGVGHPFSIDGAYQPAKPPTPYWPGRDVVRGAALARVDSMYG
jgi:hypothetical protein